MHIIQLNKSALRCCFHSRILAQTHNLVPNAMAPYNWSRFGPECNWGLGCFFEPWSPRFDRRALCFSYFFSQPFRTLGVDGVSILTCSVCHICVQRRHNWFSCLLKLFFFFRVLLFFSLFFSFLSGPEISQFTVGFWITQTVYLRPLRSWIFVHNGSSLPKQQSNNTWRTRLSILET